MIQPIIEYAPAVWSPHLQRDILKLKSVPRRSARLFTILYSLLEILTKKLQSLSVLQSLNAISL